MPQRSPLHQSPLHQSLHQVWPCTVPGVFAAALVACGVACGGEAPAEALGLPGGNGGSGPMGNGGSGPMGNGGSRPGADPAPSDPGVNVTLRLQSQALDQLSQDLALAREHDAASLVAAHAVPFASLNQAMPIVGLDRIQGSAIALSGAELEQLGENGFVILRRKQYPSFPYGYFDIYSADLPVYVTADMVLEAVHRSYDNILKAVEVASLAPRLTRLLGAMRARLSAPGAALSAQAAEDADFYLTVAQSLLSESAVTPALAKASEVADFVAKANAASGSRLMSIFGTEREIDFSQFKPRGHYEGNPALERYFRAMMWLGRIDLRMIETNPDGTQTFWRRQLEAALGLRSLLDAESLADWRTIDRVIGAFVGEHDYMTLPQLDELLAALGTTPAAGLGDLPDEAVAQAIVDGQYGEQRIASHIIRKSPAATGTLPLSSSFAFFGQRYTVDSHVFSNVVFDRVATRVLPDPLDAAFAALGNDQAVSLLATELAEHPYAGALSGMRTLVDAHPAEYWQSSLYTSWLSALRTLSPNAEGAGPEETGLPQVARTGLWGRRLLNTQLASWAELRHDTILYVKQSYTTGTLCEFPDAYVEPYPELFRSLARFAELGQSVTAELTFEGDYAGYDGGITTYFENLRRITNILADMAELQRTGQPHSPEHVEFINQAIRIEGGGSGDPWQTGWYKDLFFGATGLEYDPTIADVHTDPGGDIPVARGPSVLHVGTGMPRPMVVSVDTCEGPRAYAAYHEHKEPNLNRLTDIEWEAKIAAQPPADVPWLAPVLAAP
jgi:hypothetical protein